MKSKPLENSDAAKRKLNALSELRRKLEDARHNNDGYVTVSPESFGELFPPPGTYDTDKTPGSPIPEPETAPPVEVGADLQPKDEGRDPPFDSKLPWSERELKYLHHPDLIMIYHENPEELPPRIHARAERMAESRRYRAHGFNWY